jgi:Arc/MetJ-type ribon-helix-helix transcriptional regulator
MTVTLPSTMDEAVARHARAAGFNTPEEFVCSSLERMLAEAARHEAAVLEGLAAEVSPLSPADLDGVRSLVRQARERAAA